MQGSNGHHIPLGSIAAIPVHAGWHVKEINRRLIALTHLARTNLVVQAKKALHTSMADYIRGIQPAEIKHMGLDIQGQVDVLGALPFMVEHGAEAWDLRLTLLKPGTRSLKKSKEGHYFLHVPMRHTAPGTSGKMGTPMGTPFTPSERPDSRAYRGTFSQRQAQKLGENVHKAAQQLTASRSAPGRGTKWGERLEAGHAPVLRLRHSTDIYAGMVRNEKTYEAATQSSYMTFRTISNNPASFRQDAGGKNWEHPGITARHLVPKTQAYIGEIVESGAFFEL